MYYILLMFVCCAVKSEVVSNYYVVEMPESDTPQQNVKDIKKDFRVYWNVPTMQCTSKKILFENLYEKFGIIQNDGDRFNGEKITILYEPGDFPAIFKNESSGKYRLRNGGVPQEGSLEEHIDAFRIDLNQTIPDPKFDGIGIIDFESWRPVFRQNFGVLVPYKDVSIEIEKQLHWWWPKTWIQAQATQRFEAAARRFMQTTLSIAKQMRPKALWGYYGFPHCFNMASNNMKETCAKNVPEENDSSVSLSSTQLSSLINGRVKESVRVRFKNTPVLPYFWFRYRDAGFMKQEDLSVALSTLYQSKASGLIIWGSSNDVNTVDKCKKLYNYVETILGPKIAKYTKQNVFKDEINNELNNTLTTVELSTTEVPENTTISMKIGQIDPEYDWIPPKNYTEDISQQVDEELTKKGFNRTENNEVDVLSSGAGIDFLYDALLNVESNGENEDIEQTTRSADSDESSQSTAVTNNGLKDDMFDVSEDYTQETSTILVEITTDDQKNIPYNHSTTNVIEYTENYTNGEITNEYETTQLNTDKESENFQSTEDSFYDLSNFFSSSEETSDYLIKVEKINVTSEETSSDYSYKENSSDYSDYFVVLRYYNVNKTKSQKRMVFQQIDREDISEVTENSDQVVTYVYGK
ncbi:putative hyaluronidase [Danaus plexippus plexippus]|uniref:Hyaluronidase n=1 Tax=Danaus plexippus plexippus TaxID=278856 RepID=A0A212F1S1_DANPL|nr:hyaluronidase-like [Danaus plexippus plexippus]OWR47682.1 putative hyaluronidase [Danaus plexippus plexippus]